ncbi:GTP-binding protein gtr2 [Thecaphora frezii]
MPIQPSPSPSRQPRLHVPLVGLRRSGKSSLLNVVYNNLHPDDTLFLESTLRPATVLSNSFLPIAVIDTPGGILLGANRLDAGLPLSSASSSSSAAAVAASQPSNAAPAASSPDLLAWTDVSALIFVIDAQDDYFEALAKLHTLILSAFAQNQTIDFHVFIHKIDGYSDDYRQETLGDIRGKVLDDLVDSSPSFVAQPWSFPTSPNANAGGGNASAANANGRRELEKSRSRSCDFGALGHSPALEAAGYDASTSEVSLFSSANARNDAAAAAGQINLEAAVRLHFHLTSIFDTSVFVACSKVQQSLMQKTQSLEGAQRGALSARQGAGRARGERLAASRPAVSSPLAGGAALGGEAGAGARAPTLAETVETLCDSICASCKLDKAFLLDVRTRTFVGSDSTPFDAASFDVVLEYAGFLSKFAGLYANATPSSAECGGAPARSGGGLARSSTRAGGSGTRLASSVARLGPETTLAFWQLDQHLALMAILKTEVHARQSGLMDYNVCFFQRAIVRLLAVVRCGI